MSSFGRNTDDAQDELFKIKKSARHPIGSRLVIERDLSRA
jgi:hypothetical protein